MKDLYIEAHSLIDVDVDAFVNDQYIGSYHLDPGLDVIDLGRIIDCSAEGRNSINTLKLVHSDLFIPAVINKSSKDKRELSAGYKEISVKHCPEQK